MRFRWGPALAVCVPVWLLGGLEASMLSSAWTGGVDATMPLLMAGFLGVGAWVGLGGANARARAWAATALLAFALPLVAFFAEAAILARAPRLGEVDELGRRTPILLFLLFGWPLAGFCAVTASRLSRRVTAAARGADP